MIAVAVTVAEIGFDSIHTVCSYLSFKCAISIDFCFYWGCIDLSDIAGIVASIDYAENHQCSNGTVSSGKCDAWSCGCGDT